MKKCFMVILSHFIFVFAAFSQKYEFKVVTTVESVAPFGFGGSRMIAVTDSINFRQLTMDRGGRDRSPKDSARPELGINRFEETPLFNFFNGRGIRYENIAANDAVITSKLNSMSDAGWELAFVNSGVESGGGKDDNIAMYITRYVFRRIRN